MTSPLKWHGGKHYLAPHLWNLARKTPHIHRVEVFGGSLAFTLESNPDGYSEVVNDIHHDLMNFWTVLRDEFTEFKRLCDATPFSQETYKECSTPLVGLTYPAVDHAWRFFVTCRQSLAGRMKGFATLSKNRIRRRMNEQASAWLTTIEGLPEVHERLQRVVILSKDYNDVMSSEDTPNTLFYCDPPYYPWTRTSPQVYDYEMAAADHQRFLTIATTRKGKVMISGYDCPAYSNALTSWNRHTFDLPNNAAGGEEKRRMEEVVWTNF